MHKCHHISVKKTDHAVVILLDRHFSNLKLCAYTHHIERTVFDLFPFAVINRGQFEFNPARGGVVLFFRQVELSRPDQIQARLTQLLLLP